MKVKLRDRVKAISLNAPIKSCPAARPLTQPVMRNNPEDNLSEIWPSDYFGKQVAEVREEGHLRASEFRLRRGVRLYLLGPD